MKLEQYFQFHVNYVYFWSIHRFDEEKRLLVLLADAAVWN